MNTDYKVPFLFSKSGDMNSNFYSPSLQRQWADEVLYLHSLWRASTTSNPNPNLGVAHSIHFKKPHKHEPNLKEVEWPINPAPSEPGSDFTPWPDPIPIPKPVSQPEQDKSKPDVVQLQKCAVKLSKDHFVKDDEELSEEDEDEEEDELNALEFFKGLFEKDKELRGCYEKYCENGEFYCLVCVGIGFKLLKKYKDCVALVQHSIAVKKTKRKRAHRGFGRAICGLLGWKFERLPSIVLDVGECSKKNVQAEEEQKADAVQNEPINEIIKLPEDVKNDVPNDVFMDAAKPKEHESPNAYIVDNKDGQDGTSEGAENIEGGNEGHMSPDRQLQQRSLNVCREFLAKPKDEGSSDDGCSKKELATRESIAFMFFWSIFTKDGGLRNYYERNHAKGKFYCPVCGAIGTNGLKPFESCYGLVQHTRGVTLVKRRWAHLAFGKVVCRVLGWDFS